jgi:DNA-binding beta-propeller fold protein YncE
MSGSPLSLKRLARRQVVALSSAGLVLLVVTAAALAVTGDLTQPAGTAGCISQNGAGPCADGHALFDPRGIAVSPGGKSVYVTSFNAVVRLTRNTTTGAITQPAGAAGCVSDDGSGPCADGHAIFSPGGIAVSPDGKNVYVASGESDAVVRFNRNTTTGAITQPAGAAGCISEDGSGPCADGHALDSPASVAVSPDGKNVYVASAFSSAVARFNRNTTTGAITQPAGVAGCISEDGSGPCADGHALSSAGGVVVGPDGKSVYATAFEAVVRLTRNTTTGAITQPAGIAGCVSETGSGPCADGHGLKGAASVVVSPDAKSVYVASPGISNAVALFTRDTTTGAITQPAGTAGCVSQTGAGPCVDGRALNGVRSVAMSADGKSVYVASQFSNAVARFDRDTTTGTITQPADATGCVSETGAGPCADGHALGGPRSVVVSRDGKTVYAATHTPNPSSTNAVVRFSRAP